MSDSGTPSAPFHPAQTQRRMLPGKRTVFEPWPPSARFERPLPPRAELRQRRRDQLASGLQMDATTRAALGCWEQGLEVGLELHPLRGPSRTQCTAIVSQHFVRASRTCLRTLYCSRGCGCMQPGHVSVIGMSGGCSCRCSFPLLPTVRALGAAQPTERRVRGASLGGGGSSWTRSDPPE